MPDVKIMMVIVVLLVVLIVGWQISSSEVANYELQDDLRDLASQAGSRIGLLQQASDDDLRETVIRKAKEHGIELRPDWVKVERSGSGDTSTVFLEADYNRVVSLPGISFSLHFKPSAGR
jgi:hypothetical protein